MGVVSSRRNLDPLTTGRRAAKTAAARATSSASSDVSGIGARLIYEAAVSLDAHLERELAKLSAQGIFRARSEGPPSGVVNVSRNDYLGYASRVVSRETRGFSGAGASRLIFGTRDAHIALERRLAAWVEAEDALVFSSGYSANLGTIAALAQSGDLVVSDESNHASLIDGCRLSRAKVVVTPHRDLGALAEALELPCEGRRWVLTESYFSMDGDSPDLTGLRKLCDEAHAALLVDESHALGVFGPSGAGLCRACGVNPDVLIAGLGKAVGASGAFVAGSRALTSYLWNRARSFVFSTGVSPFLCEIIMENVRAVQLDDAGRDRLSTVADQLRVALKEFWPTLPDSRHGPIFPIVFGSIERTLRASDEVRAAGFLAQAIRPPTVAEGASRLRIALASDLSDDEVTRLIEALRFACRAS